MTGLRLAILLTCHNRVSSTVACLDRLSSCELPQSVETQVILVDDGSTDGTSDTVRRHHPAATVIAGSGQLFWNGGMRRAMEVAADGGYDFFLWLNDDVLLTQDALVNLLKTYHEVTGASSPRPAIIVGTTCDPETGEATYGGRFKTRGRLLPDFPLLHPSSEPREAVTMNGNCVLLPASAVQLTGPLDPAFTHGMGDWDYGLRARRAGVRLVVCPGYIGTCSPNASEELPPGVRRSVRAQLQRMSDAKALPYGEWFTYTRRHWPVSWPIHWTRPYAAAVMAAVRWKSRALLMRSTRRARARHEQEGRP